ncbi:MAG TPA: flagellar biosynthetic protein FliO [Lacipirellulaceae bacterium]|jgi:flagellar biogenesis protein FliO|nr:flagellar biosynthetic protein FliO [Lacipirellulaceae bacterium]
MLNHLRLAAGSLLLAIFAASAWAENTPAPPDWQDSRSASKYLELAQKHGAATTNALSVGSPEPTLKSPAPFSAPPISSPLPGGSASTATQANFEDAAHADDGRHLAPPTGRPTADTQPSSHTPFASHLPANFGVPSQSIYTMITALAIVIGVFLLFAWTLRRGSTKAGGRLATLPTEVVQVLGRIPIAARQFAQLLRVGNKLVLVALTPEGPTTLTEVTDPAEVDRLVGLCQQTDAKSTSKMFEQVFQQFSAEPTGGSYLGSDSIPSSISTAASAYRSHRGTTRA